MIPFRLAILAALHGLPLMSLTRGDELVPVAIETLNAPPLSHLGQSALGIGKQKWLHAESQNFVFHYTVSRPANEAAVEVEFYASFFAKELGRTNKDGQRKGHIFIFEDEKNWQQFQQGARLEPWTGGIQVKNELFILRSSAKKYSDTTLAHETAHLTLFRFFGGNIPLWLNEGYAEYAGIRAWASWQRMHGLIAKPRSLPVPQAKLFPLTELLSMNDYPAKQDCSQVFYNQSERLVRFLSATDKGAFLQFLDLVACGERFDSAFSKAFGNRFLSLQHLENQFRSYVSQEYALFMRGTDP